MPTVYEVTISATNNGKQHVNVFHVWDGDDNANLGTIATVFVNEFCTPLLPVLSGLFTWNDISVKSLTGVNPGTFDIAIGTTGNAAGDGMPTGVHIFTKFLSGDTSFRSGGKLVGGSVENSWTDGEPTNAYLDAMQIVFDALLAALPIAASVALAIYRPSLSIPGLPVTSIVSAVLTRGNSTNNRRRKDFER